MKYLIPLLCFFFSFSILRADLTQEALIEHSPTNYFRHIDLYANGQYTLDTLGNPMNIQEYFSREFRPTKEMIDSKLNGIIYVNFVVDKDGALKNIKVRNDLGYGSGELIKVIVEEYAKVYKWNPGLQRGKPVRVKFSLPINIDMSRYNADE